MQFPVKWSPRKGGLQSDITEQEIADGDLILTTPETGCLNLRAIGKGTQQSPDYELITGNEFSYEPAPVVTQNKRFRVFVESVTNKTFHSIQFYTPNGLIISPAWLASNLGVTTEYANIVGELAKITISGLFTYNYLLNGVVVVAGAALVVTSPTTGYFDIEITQVPFWDYSITVSWNKQPLVLQEAIDASMLGAWKDIGNNDQLGDEFHFWTTRDSQQTLTITGVLNTVPVIRIFANNTLTNGQAVIIKDVVGTTSANGTWIIGNVTPTYFDLLGSNFNAPYISGGVVITNPYGLGEIGVGVKNENNQSWNYTRLIRSKEFGFFIDNLIDCRFKRKNDGNIAGYFVERGNNPRVFYYKGAYIQDGALSINGGQYEYGSISDEMRWIIAQSGGAGFKINVDSAAQIQVGGNVFSGNWRYAAEFLTDKLSPSGYTPLTNPIPVFRADVNGAADQIFGQATNVSTTKQNVINIFTPIEGLFKYVRIAAINYLDDGSYTGVVLNTYLLTGSVTTIIHTGFETNTTDLDIGTINAIQSNIDIAENVELSENRAILSRLTVKKTYNLLPFAQTIRHSVLRKTLPAVGSKTAGTLQVAEYEKPENVYLYGGYRMNETYRFGFKGKKNGRYISDIVYFVDDIKIDSNTINTAFGSIPTRRVRGLQDSSGNPSMDLTNLNATEIYVPYIEFSNINLDFIVEGSIKIRDIIDEIEWYRVEMDANNREVLADGVWVGGIRFKHKSAQPQGGFLWPRTISGYEGVTNDVQFSTNVSKNIKKYIFFYSSHEGVDQIDNATYGINRQDLTDYIFACGLSYHSGVGNLQYNDPNLASTGSYNMEIQRQFGSVYSPDLILSGGLYNQSTGDELFVYGAPNRTLVTFVGGRTSGSTNYEEGALQNNISEFSGFTNIQNGIYPFNYNSFSIDSSINIARAAVDRFNNVSGQPYYSKRPFQVLVNSDTTPPNLTIDGWYIEKDLPSSPVIHSTTNITTSTAYPDMGVYRSQIFRRKDGKFGDIATSKYIYTGSSYQITTATPSVIGTGIISVFGGDVFTQKNYLKHIRTNDYSRASGSTVAFSLAGFEQGMSYYSQNVPNSQMIDLALNTDSTKFPLISQNDWLNVNGKDTSGNTIFSEGTPFFKYSKGYDIRNQITSQAAFDPNADYQVDWGNAFIWSESEGDGTVTDQMRYFPPLNIKFQDYTDGHITDLKELNGEIITLQPRKILREYYNTTNVVTSTEGSEVILGQSAVFARKGVVSSLFGCQTKGSVRIGLSDKGHQALYFWDLINKVVCRIGYDGSNSLDEIHGIKSFVANNTQFLIGKNTYLQNIGSFSNQRYREVGWTVNGIKDVPQWQSVVGGYGIGAEVTDGGEIYISLILNNTFPPTGHPLSASIWEKISHLDNRFYNQYTLVWSELKNKFQAFHSYKPHRYAQYKNTFLSILDNGRVYEHDRGRAGEWYDGTLKSGGFKMAVVNIPKNIVNYFIALRYFGLERKPDRVDLYTKNNYSFLLDTDFTKKENFYNSTIKNDATTTATNPSGRNDLRTSRIYGDYLIVKTWIFNSRPYQRIGELIVKLRNSARLNDK